MGREEEKEIGALPASRAALPASGPSREGVSALRAAAANAGHAPGPWHFRLEAVRTVIFHKAEIGERAIAVGAGCYPDHIANARLIAAAPELYEALVEARAELEGYHADANRGELYNNPRINAAIRKADGKP